MTTLVIPVVNNKELDDSAYAIEKLDSGYLQLNFSNLGSWSRKGEKSTSLMDNGDGYVFKDHFSKKTFKIGYDQMQQLQILLKLMHVKAEFKLFKEVIDV